MGWYLDGRVTAVVGTHTHVPTADARVLPKGTAYISDIGMTGPRDSVIGFSPGDGAAAIPDPPADPLRGCRRAGQLQRGADRGGAGERTRYLDHAAAAPHRGLTPADADRSRPSSVRPARARRSSRWRWRARLPLEILVADSRQVYRGMDIGTAKPDAAARAASRIT